MVISLGKVTLIYKIKMKDFPYLTQWGFPVVANFILFCQKCLFFLSLNFRSGKTFDRNKCE